MCFLIDILFRICSFAIQNVKKLRFWCKSDRFRFEFRSISHSCHNSWKTGSQRTDVDTIKTSLTSLYVLPFQGRHARATSSQASISTMARRKSENFGDSRLTVFRRAFGVRHHSFCTPNPIQRFRPPNINQNFIATNTNDANNTQTDAGSSANCAERPTCHNSQTLLHR